jgi:hypothetical protein
VDGDEVDDGGPLFRRAVGSGDVPELNAALSGQGTPPATVEVLAPRDNRIVLTAAARRQLKALELAEGR